MQGAIFCRSELWGKLWSWGQNLVFSSIGDVIRFIIQSNPFVLALGRKWSSEGEEYLPRTQSFKEQLGKLETENQTVSWAHGSRMHQQQQRPQRGWTRSFCDAWSKAAGRLWKTVDWLSLLWDWPSCWMWFLNQPSLVDYARRANSQNSNGKLFPLGWWGTKSKSSVNLDSHMWLSDGMGPWMNYMQPEKLMLHTWGPHLKGRTASEKTLPGIKELWRAESTLIWYASKGGSLVTLWSSTGIMYNKWARAQIERKAKKKKAIKDAFRFSLH